MSKSIFEELSEERKQLQSEGKLPNWFTTQGWQMFKEKYLYEADTYEEQIDRIVNTAAKHVPKESDRVYLSGRWKEMFMKGHAYLATPTLANTGTTRGLPVSCSGGYIGDSVYSFYEGIKEAAVLSQEGFGTSAYLGDIRERGSEISRGGTANGIVPVFEDFVTMADKISQGSSRRGAWAGYLPMSHGDFWELSTHIKNEPEGSNVGWNIHDSDVDALNNGCPDATARFQKALHTKCITGKGYYWFVDKIARQQPQMYKDLGLSNKASNLCVAPETTILTDKGQIPIAELVDEVVNIWNGEEFSKVTVRKTGSNQKLIKVLTDSGQELECTEYHKFYVQEGYGKPPVEKSTKDLKSGDKLIKFNLPVVSGEKVLDNAWQNGFFTGDGGTYNGKDRVYLYHDKRSLADYFDFNTVHFQEEQKRIYGNVDGLKSKYFVPSEDYTLQSRLDWLAGWLDADGCIYRNGSNEQVVGSSVELNFLKEVQLMLQTCGVECKIQLLREEGVYELPANDGTGDNKPYNCQISYRLIINSNGLFKLHQLGISFKRLKTIERKPQRSASHFIKVVEVLDEGRVEDTYCFTEPKRGMGMFNGILTGQCSEISLHADEDHTYTCVISGMICSTYDEWKKTDAVYCMTIFLDCIVSEFLGIAGDIKGLEKAIRGTVKSRAIGLGLSGLHSYFQKNMWPFSSYKAHIANKEIFKHLHDESLKASQWMAKEWGEPEWCKGYGVRNTHRTALAPNVSSSLIFGSESQGITPWYGNVYNEGSASGGMFRVNPLFIKLLKKYDKYNDDVIQSVLQNNGSCQHLDFLSDLEKNVFKTFFEINQEDVLRLAGSRQPDICQSQSLNLAIAADEKEERVAELHQMAFEDENIMALYYLRSKSGIAASTGVTCSNCES